MVIKYSITIIFFWRGWKEKTFKFPTRRQGKPQGPRKSDFKKFHTDRENVEDFLENLQYWKNMYNITVNSNSLTGKTYCQYFIPKNIKRKFLIWQRYCSKSLVTLAVFFEMFGVILGISQVLQLTKIILQSSIVTSNVKHNLPQQDWITIIIIILALRYLD